METCKGLGSLSSPSVSFLSLPQNIFSSTILRDGTFYFNIVTSLFFPLLLHPPPNKHPLSLTEFEYRYASQIFRDCGKIWALLAQEETVH